MTVAAGCDRLLRPSMGSKGLRFESGRGLPVFPCSAAFSLSSLASRSVFGVHRASTAWDVERFAGPVRVEQLDRVRAAVAGEVAIVAVDHRRRSAL
jgi:hypothetical protein